MNLTNKLESISAKNTVEEISSLLTSAQANINWLGVRVITVEGYTGCIEIDKIVLKYLQADIFNRNTQKTIQERLDCYALWGRIQKLYRDSEAKLNNGYLLKYYTYLKDYKFLEPIDSPIAIINGWDFRFNTEWYSVSPKEVLFEFTPEEFEKICDGKEPVAITWVKEENHYSKRCVASKEMLESVL